MPIPTLNPWAHPLTRTPELALSLVIGNAISFCLFGALTVQLYMYYITFINDSKKLKATIYFIYLAETVYTAMLAYDLVDLVLNPTYNGCFASLIVPICGGLQALLTQAVYAHRIRIITQMKFIPLCLVALITVEFVLTVAFMTNGISLFLVALIWAVCCLCADLTIAIIMVRTLNKDEIYSRELRRRITRLSYLFVGCGLLTARIVAVNIVLLVGSSLSSSGLTLACGIVLSKIYANSMMVLVNSRPPPEGSSRGEIATLQIDTLRFGSLSVRPTATTTTTKSNEEWQEQQLKTDVTGEAPGERA
ncbi:hypothetical protein F5887DRAFT_1156987 [Amanita rubescens]|nr:hypothetical protein F5887DRAFT_1156987 [Amanita rubescens]